MKALDPSRHRMANAPISGEKTRPEEGTRRREKIQTAPAETAIETNRGA